MKGIFILLFTFSFSFTNLLIGQELELDKGSLEDHLNTLKDTTGWSFNYDPAIIRNIRFPLPRKIDISNKSLALAGLLYGTKIDFEMADGVIILLPIIFSIVFIVVRRQSSEFLLWITLLLGLNLIVGIIYFNVLTINVMAWFALLLLLGSGLRLLIGGNGFLKELR